MNRTISWTRSGILYQADGKHAQVAIAQLGLEEAKVVATPMMRESTSEGDDDDEKDSERGGLLGDDQARLFRSVIARLNYLASDRPDLQFAVRVCSSGMAKPHWKDLQRLKRIVRYINYIFLSKVK